MKENNRRGHFWPMSKKRRFLSDGFPYEMNYNGVCKTDIGFARVCLKVFNLKAKKKITKGTLILETKKNSATIFGISCFMQS